MRLNQTITNCKHTHTHTHDTMSSLFRKPKKNIQRRAFSDFPDDQDHAATRDGDAGEKSVEAPKIKQKEPKPEKTPKERPATKTLLSFGDEDGEWVDNSPVHHLLTKCPFSEEEEVFQVKKSSQSKKVMRQLDKERRKKAKGGSEDTQPQERTPSASVGGSELSNKPPLLGGVSGIASGTDATVSSVRNDISGKKIQTEIRTDDFVVRLLLSDTFSNPTSIVQWRKCLVADPPEL